MFSKTYLRGHPDHYKFLATKQAFRDLRCLVALEVDNRGGGGTEQQL